MVRALPLQCVRNIASTNFMFVQEMFASQQEKINHATMAQMFILKWQKSMTLKRN